MSDRNEEISDLLKDLLKVLNKSDSDIDSIIGDNQTDENSNSVYQLLNDWLTKHYYQKNDVKRFFNDVNKVLIGYSKHSFHRELPFQNDETFDTLVTGINFLGEELNHSTVTTHYLHDIFSSIGDIVIVINKKGNMLYLNSKAFSLLEFSESELKDKSIKTILEKNTSVTELMNVDLLNKSVNFISNTGKTIPTKITVSNFSRPDNPMMGYVIVARDMSFYLEYQKSIELFRNLFNDHTAINLLIDAETLQIENANHAAQVFYGGTIEDLKMLKFSELNVIDDADSNDLFSELIDSQKMNLQMKHRKFDGSICDVEIFPSTIVSEGKKIIHAIIHDISDRKKVEQSLLKREKELQSIFKGVPIGIGFEVNNQIIEVNQRITELLGYSKVEMIGKDIRCFYSSTEEYDFVKSNVYPQAIKKGVGFGETRWKRKDDVLLDIIFSISPMQIDDPQQGFIFSLLNITENKKIQNELFESEQKYRRIAENMSDVVWICDLNFNITYISPSIEQLIGESPEKHALRTPSEKFPPQTLETLQNILQEELQLDHHPDADKNRNRIIEIEHYKTDGSIIWVELSMTFVRDGKGVPIGIQGTTRDIEKRKQFEIELEKSNRVFTHSLDMLCIAGFDGYFKTINPAWEKTLGWSAKELTSKPWIDFVHPDDIEKTKNIKLTTLDNGVDVYSFENRYICKDGSVKWLSWNSYPYVQENILIGVARDITERKKEEELIQSHYALMKIAGETAIIGGWSVDLQSNISSWSDVVADIHEVPRGISTLVSEGINYYTPEYREKIAEVFKKCAEDGIAYDEEMQIITAKGNLKWVRTIGEALRNHEGQIVKVFGAFQDITKSKENEQKLLVATRQLQLHLENSPLAVIEWDAGFRVKRWTAQAEAIFGWTESDVLGKHPNEWNFIFDEDAQNVNIEIEGLLNKRFSKHTNFNRNLTKDGNVIHCEWFNSVVADENDNLMSILSLIQDVTDKVKTSKELMQRERTLQQIFDILPVGLWYADENGKLLSGNPAGIKIWGAEPLVDPSEYGVFKAKRLPTREEIQPHDWALTRTIQTGTTITDEILEIEAFDGKIKTILNYTAPIFDNKEKIIGAIVVNQDITEIKEYEQLLKKSVENWDQTFNAIQDAIALIDKNQNIIQTNKAFTELVGDFPEKYIGCQCHLYVHGSKLPHNDCPFTIMLQSKKREVQEMMINDKICNVLVDPIIDELGKIIGAVHIISDITEQKMNEIKLSDIYTRQRIISESIVLLNDIDDIDDIFQTLGNIVYENIDNTYIICVKDRPEMEDLNIVNQHGGDAFVEQVVDIIGIPLQNFSISLNEYSKKHIDALKSGKLLKMKSGLKELVGKKYSGQDINSIESLLDIKSVYAIGISLHNRLFGGIGILSKNHKLDNQVIDLIESLIQNATTIIQTKWLSNELKLSEKRYKTFFDSSSSMVYLKDSNLNYVLVNKSMVQFFGKTENQILGQNDFKLLPKKIAEVCMMNDKKALQSNTVVVSIEKIGNQIFQSTKFRVILSSGEVGIGGYINDVTKEKQDERDLMLMNSLNESINKGLSLEIIVSNLKTFIFEEFDAHHVDVLFVSDDGMHLTWKKDQISKINILQIEKVLGSEINNELNITIHPENWYGRMFQNNQPHITSTEEEIKEIINVWLKSNIQFIPENLNFSEIISTFKIYTSMLTIPMVFNEKNIGLFHIIFNSKIEAHAAERLKRLSDQLMVLMDRKRSEQILQQTQLLLRETQAVAHLGGWSYHVETHMFSLTDEFYEIVGKDARTNLNNFSDLMQYFSAEDSKILNNAFLRLIKSGKPLDYELQLLQKSEKKIWIRIIGKPVIKNEKVIRIVGYFMNVDDRKNAEFYLKESEDKYRTLVEISTDAIFVIQNDKFVYLNKAASDLFGAKNVNELIGYSLFDYLQPDSQEVIAEKIEKMILNSKPGPLIEEKIIRNDGTIRDVEIVATPFSYKGKPAIQVILREITERRNLQKAILNAVITSEENERDRIAKDLHDGIGPLLSTAKLVLQTHLATTKTNSKLEEHSLSLIDEAITGISEISHNISPHVLNNYGLSRAIETFVNKLRKVVPQKIKFKSNVPNRLESITEITLYRITLELINNCIKHTQAKDIRIELLQNNNIIILKVLHDGSGFDFENAMNQGKGMGLINIKNRVNSLDGKLIWDNRKHMGMLVQIEIPKNI